MKLSKRQLKRIIKEEKLKILREGTYEKLNSEVTGDDSNLDQEMYFDLMREVEIICGEYAEDPRFAPYGVTRADVLEELKNVIREME